MNSFVTRPKPPGAMWPYKGPLKGYMVKHLNDLRGSQDLRDLLEKFYTYWIVDDELKTCDALPDGIVDGPSEQVSAAGYEKR